MKNTWPCFFIICVILSCTQKQKPEIAIQGELKQWHKITLVIPGVETSEQAPENPFLHYRLEVSFSQGDHTIKVPGFYAADGNAAESSANSGSAWQVHFRPDQPGEWRYNVSFRKEKDIAISDDENAGEPTEFDGNEGSIQIMESDKAGRDFRVGGKIINGGKGYFHYQETGELFIKNGADSPENFLAYADFDQTLRHANQVFREGEANPDNAVHHYAPHLTDWNNDDPTWQGDKGKEIIGAINYLAEQGINSMYMLTLNIMGDGKDVWPYIDHNERYRFDCSKLDQWEIVFDHMESKGVMMHLVMQETENETLLDMGYTEVQRKLYLRELTARFGHHLAVIWNMGEENGPTDWSPIGQTDDQRKAMANYMKQINPYQPIVFLHTHSNDQDQEKYLDPLLDFANLDGASMQIAVPERINERINYWKEKSTRNDSSWIVNLDELGPHWKGILPDEFDVHHDTVRSHALWGTLLAGGGGVEWYFGYRFPHTDLDCEDFRSRENWWEQSTMATNFMRQFQLESMKGANDLIDSGNAYCMAQPGLLYLVYIPDASQQTSLKLDTEKEFILRWFNAKEGGSLQEGSIKTIQGPGIVSLGQPPAAIGKDWVVVVEAI